MANSKISQIKLPNGSTYDINAVYFGGKDSEEWLQLIEGATHFLGIITSVDELGVTGVSATDENVPSWVSKGDFYRIGNNHSFGVGFHAGDLLIALKDIPAKEVTLDSTATDGYIGVHGEDSAGMEHVHDIAHTHSGDNLVFEDASVSVSGTSSGTVAISVGTGTANYTPAGEVELQHTPTGTTAAGGNGIALEHSHTYEKATSATISVGTGTANYTPAGSVSQPTFTGSDGNTGSALANDTSVEVAVDCGTHNHEATFSGSAYTPEGTVTVSNTSTDSLANDGTAVSVVTGITPGTLTSGTASGTGKIKYVEAVTHATPTVTPGEASDPAHTHGVTGTANTSADKVSVSTGVTAGSLTINDTAANGLGVVTDVTHTAASLTGTKTFVTGYDKFSGGSVNAPQASTLVSAAVEGEVLIIGAADRVSSVTHTAASLGTPTTGTVGISGGGVSKTTKYLHYTSASSAGSVNVSSASHTHSVSGTAAASDATVAVVTGVTHSAPSVTTKYLTYASAKASGTGSAAPNGHKHKYDKATSATFAGTGKAVAGTVTVNNATVSGTGAGTLDLAHTHSFKPAGTVSKPSFTGTGKQLVVTLGHTSTNTDKALTGTAAAQSHTHSYDKATLASFSGTGVELKAVFTGKSHTSTGTYKKLKSVSFSGKSGQPE